jgi:hypothetical protein
MSNGLLTLAKLLEGAAGTPAGFLSILNFLDMAFFQFYRSAFSSLELEAREIFKQSRWQSRYCILNTF